MSQPTRVAPAVADRAAAEHLADLAGGILASRVGAAGIRRAARAARILADALNILATSRKAEQA